MSVINNVNIIVFVYLHTGLIEFKKSKSNRSNDCMSTGLLAGIRCVEITFLELKHLTYIIHLSVTYPLNASIYATWNKSVKFNMQ